jgi:predicted dehydrogenase
MRASPRTAWSAGVAVIVEKPIAHTLEDAQHICDVSRSKDIPALVGHHRRYNPIVRHAKQIIDSGKLGRPVTATVLCTWRKPDEYFNVAGAGNPAVARSS